MNLMGCQNCGSTEVVGIQGQNYCLNCGQLVTTKAAAVKTPAKAAADSEPLPLAPVIKPVKPVIKARDEKVEIPLAKSIQKFAKAAPVKVTVAKPQPPAVKPKADTKSAKSVLAKTPAAPINLKPYAEPKAVEHQKRAAVLPELISLSDDALASVAKIRSQSLVVLIAGLLALPPLAWLISGWLLPTELLQADSLRFQILSAAAIATMGLTLWRLWVWAGNAVIFGTSRQSDNRPVQPISWQRIGWSSSAATLGLQFLQLGFIVLVAGVLFIIPNYTGLLTKGPEFGPALLNFGMDLVLVYLALDLLGVLRLARVAVVLSDVGPGKALALSWRMSRRRPRWMIASIILGGLINGAMLVGILSLMVVLWSLLAGNLDNTLALFALVLAGYLLTVAWLAGSALFNAAYWTDIYRYLVKADFPQKISSMVAGRQAKPVGFGKTFAAGVAWFAIIGLAAYLSLGHLDQLSSWWQSHLAALPL